MFMGLCCACELAAEKGKSGGPRTREKPKEKPEHLADMSRSGLIIYVLVSGAPDKT